ncbi:hypothetical protein ACB092_01G425900 [Castanea dentata]
MEMKITINGWQIASQHNLVPYHIRSVNPQAYTPNVISIGPFHHFDEKLQTMEKYKVAYLRGFIARVGIDLEKFVSIIKKEMEEMIRCCYAETSSRSMSSDDFVKMISLDAIFILELFHRYSTDSWDINDPLLTNQWMIPFVMLDLTLLENQLPFFVLEKLFNLAFGNHSNFSLIQLTFEFFEDYNVMHCEKVEIEHFTDLIRTFQLPPLRQPDLRRPERQVRVANLFYSATQLHEAGVKAILFNKLVDNNAALSLVKNLITNITRSGMNSDFTYICKELNQFYMNPVHRWKARSILKNQYFNNPWRGAATVAACLLLLFTLIQTIMSILQVVKA